MLWFRRINLLTLALCFCVVVFGAYVRLSDAGLGCPDWPGCYGHLTVPDTEHEIAKAEARFPQRPVEAPKAWKEMIHRYLASSLGVLIIALALMSRRLREAGAPRVLPWVLVALVVFQGILGMWTVTWQLKPLVVTAHLLGGMTTLALLLWLYLSSRPSAPVHVSREYRSERHLAVELQRGGNGVCAAHAVDRAPRWLRGFAAVALIAVIVQIFLGGWTSTNYAALACPDFPTCHGSFWPPTDVKTAFTLWHGLGINYEYGILDARARVTIHHFHRVGALVVTVLLTGLGLCLLRAQQGRWRSFGIAVIAALGLQVAIGISVVVFQFPLLVAAAHNAGAALLLATLVVLNHAVWRRT
ncbi:cytochrome c oxidase assembly protein subunit 15 [Fontimonas thermophila]|uniref:Cytochrome c oxidase assembly protein subunit 15 n=1 Tax=Fontimonas thermophila TaxID=1076937 RepID=A0A1I2JZ55_9GAMM|nr:COX15/CtaA family protein [Fontimonas thermophila]SFF59449.1 cytochrome c oxidase assembly protein subunit 15 [Fontimonas thermophila]